MLFACLVLDGMYYNKRGARKSVSYNLVLFVFKLALAVCFR